MQDYMGWYIKDRIIFSRPVGDISINTIEEQNQNVVHMMTDGISPVHIVIDATFISAAPTNLLMLSKATTFLSHPSLGWVMTITNNTLIRFLGGMVPQIGRVKHYRVFSELDQCIAFLKEQDKTLDWTTANNALFLESKV